jgi:hypothetical protein
VPEAVQQAIDTWVMVHPLARGIALRDEDPLFVRIGRHAHEDPVALSAEAVYRLLRRHCLAASVPGRLAHPHALRSYWATHCLEAGVSVHEVSARLGHVDLRPPLDTPPHGQNGSTTSPTCSTAATRPPDERAGGVGIGPSHQRRPLRAVRRSRLLLGESTSKAVQGKQAFPRNGSAQQRTASAAIARVDPEETLQFDR